jgi:hypothetical protein
MAASNKRPILNPVFNWTAGLLQTISRVERITVVGLNLSSQCIIFRAKPEHLMAYGLNLISTAGEKD